MYGLTARIQRVLKTEGQVPPRADLIAQQQKFSDQVDNATRRTFGAGGTVTWTVDAPLGSILPLPDFITVTSLTRYGVSVLTDIAKIQIGKHGSPPYQALRYQPGGVATSWQDGHSSGHYQAIVLIVTAGWPSVPTPITDAVERATVRGWRQRAQMYEDTAGGVAALGLQPSPGTAVDRDVESDVADYVRRPARVVVG